MTTRSSLSSLRSKARKLRLRCGGITEDVACRRARRRRRAQMFTQPRNFVREIRAARVDVRAWWYNRIGNSAIRCRRTGKPGSQRATAEHDRHRRFHVHLVQLES